MRFCLFLLLSLWTTYATTASKVREIAILDSGFTDADILKKQCSDFKKSAGQLQNESQDYNSHGNNVAGLIVQNAGGSKYCLRLYKVFKGKKFDTKAHEQALKELVRKPAYLINMSFGGPKELDFETRLLDKILNRETIVVVSAGNEGRKLERPCDFFPACLDERLVVVGNLHENSNYGPVVDVIVNGNFATYKNLTMSGTSQSAAIYSGRLIKGVK